MPSQYDDGMPGPYSARIAGDEEIAEGIRERLIHDERVDAREVDVTVQAGAAVLSGRVGTLAAKRAAGSDAWDVAGVVEVRNLLAVTEGEPAG